MKTQGAPYPVNFPFYPCGFLSPHIAATNGDEQTGHGGIVHHHERISHTRQSSHGDVHRVPPGEYPSGEETVAASLLAELSRSDPGYPGRWQNLVARAACRRHLIRTAGVCAPFGLDPSAESGQAVEAELH